MSPSTESKLYRVEAMPCSRWMDDPDNRLYRRYHSIFAEEGQDDKPLGPPEHDPIPPVHTD